MPEKRDPLDTLIEKAEGIRPKCPIGIVEDSWVKFTDWFLKVTPDIPILPPEEPAPPVPPGEPPPPDIPPEPPEPPEPPVPPETANFIPLCCATYRIGGVRGMTESLNEVPGNSFITKVKDEILPDIAESYIAKYNPTKVIEGPRYFYKWDDPEGGYDTHSYELFGKTWERRFYYSPSPQTGVKMTIPGLEGKSWTCYLDFNAPYAFSTKDFVNCLIIKGNGSLVKFRGPTWRGDYKPLPTAGKVMMLRIEFDDQLWVIPSAMICRFYGAGYDVGHGVNWEYGLAHILCEHELELWKLSMSKDELTRLYNKYEGKLNVYPHGSVYRPDLENADEGGKILLDKVGDIWAEPVNGDFLYHVNYTLSEVETKYDTKVSKENSGYADLKALYERIRAKYERNWSDP